MSSSDASYQQMMLVDIKHATYLEVSVAYDATSVHLVK